MWLCERITGHRKTYGMNIVGGVRYDITPDKYEDIIRVISKIEKEWLEVIDAISGDTPLMMRLKGVGVLTNEVARQFCTTGPTARGSGVAIDSRVDHPYAAYEFLGVKKIVYPDGDVLARTLVRLEETIESIALVKKCISDMPDGPIIDKMDENILPYKEGISVVEAPRGEAIHYVITGEENRPYRWRVRAPTYPNLQAVPLMIQGEQLADVPITLGSIDPCFSCTERVEVIDIKKGEVQTFTQEELLELSRSRRSLCVR
ncbi:MAG: Formate hydrogenlyase subunit 5 [candidate division WS2 bacterium]|nr:Formate hydrogenlyase subunit 5 [Candidatus Lithacetigena glycinireducens]